MTSDDVSQSFWDAAQPALTKDGVQRGTMMGFPCLRLRGVYFASCDRETGDLVVKLPADRVERLIAEGEAVAFAPNGRVFREWARVPQRDAARWRRLMDEALAFAET